MTASMVERVRAFNRIVTERVGALDEQYLGRGRPLGASRVLWEIDPGGTDVRELRRRLGLDSGYASRLLRSLEAGGLIAVETAPGDRRVRRARLTEAGAAERAELDRRSDELAESMLGPLDESRRTQLVTSMQAVERLLLASLITIEAEDPATDEARWCIEQYFAELAQRFDSGFDPALSIPAAAEDITPPAGLLLVARSRARPVGCGALKFHGSEPVELKRMWVLPEARGLGLGGRLLRCLERAAGDAGATVVRLETNGSLAEAIALYRKAGYSEVDAFNDEPYAHHWFEKRLAGTV
jgi:DNA-binding MarR family transcriptional regulator/GNAT superfamily N-acetyltransferase